MKIYGVGTDLTNIYRIKKSIKNNKFVNRLFNKIEIQKCNKQTNKANCYAKRFAAKEAMSKALGTGIRKGINFKDIEIKNDKFGKPSISLKGTTEKYLRMKIKKKNYKIYLSLSDDIPWAQATVIISYT